ncbi:MULTISPECIES: cytochrome aa3 quinol oxidase subunit III [Salimicrobium]|uniref:Quinol oxidase subunit 3 n=3 Tax=Salimicrobium TaxID=351195 RepID=K2GMJ9_9BACI|nr:MULTISPECIES: cytochrome aa3 quinol oxidase subunit III [Salimicrobium]AKG04941.1 cytochrome aa3 quinol oxidase subunit III [Salimicrobium jeotgali]EKE31619.1 cytochrome aa3 quinol oxidase subunit III [Salimicrobium jeotgali]MBM7696440.1 cytochrome aa3-600 menaquinol oxidase subunit 3 [Salimicrobium jeotgali]SDX44393.1 cytochrome aa3 quinol oxidase subunit 3 [Salimicrobium album]SIS45384.1 cytochrome aa3 quinol oxidase subunit 3 [Salimicrobium salexigens]
MSTEHSTPMEYSTETNALNIIGFWVFIGAEIALFATLFATYFIMEGRIADGPSGGQLFVISTLMIQTFVLLTSSFTIGLGVNAMRLGRKGATLTFLAITLVLGAGFVGVEIYEFYEYVHEGLSLQTSAFSAGLFTLLGTHGAHVSFGLFWGAGIIVQIVKHGFTPRTANKTFIFSLYWHFLDVVWIFIFSFVYLKGMM